MLPGYYSGMSVYYTNGYVVDDRVFLADWMIARYQFIRPIAVCTDFSKYIRTFY